MYAAATATQIAYSTYIYAQVPLAKFQIVTAYTQAALLAGRCIAGVAGQLLIATELCNYYTLNFVSLAFVSAATVVALFLPNVSQSIYFHRSDKKNNKNNRNDPTKTDGTAPSNMAALEFNSGDDGDSVRSLSESSSTKELPTDGVGQEVKGDDSTLATVYRLLWIDFKSSFSNAYMLKWSLWCVWMTSIHYSFE